jgi:hypothetical protein
MGLTATFSSYKGTTWALTDKQLKAQHSGYTSVVPAIQEAEPGGSFELRYLGPAWETQWDRISKKLLIRFKNKRIQAANYRDTPSPTQSFKPIEVQDYEKQIFHEGTTTQRW